MRTRFLFCYDVRDARRLRRVGKVAASFRYRMQYSMFICDLSAVERVRLEHAIRDVLDLTVDAAVLVDLGPPSGQASERLRWLSRPLALAESGAPTIV